MKKLSIFIFCLIIKPPPSAAVPQYVVEHFRLIVKLIKNGKMAELAPLVNYPLKRENPLPDIANTKELVAYKDVLFDKALKSKILRYRDSYVAEHHGVYGLVGGPFNGDIWIDEDGKVIAINYSSKKEIELSEQLTKKIQSQTYPTVNKWTSNVVVCKSEHLLIRVDQTSRGLRYVSWSKGHSFNEKPDLILYNGVEEAQGTEGGWTWTFTNGDWKYIVDDSEVCEDQKPENCGYFLEIFYKGIEKNRIRLTETK